MFSYIKFQDLGQFANVETKCSQIMMVTADNGGGKTTFVEGVKALLDDHNANLIRIGADTAESQFEFVNGLKASQVMRREGGSTYDVRLPNGEKLLRGHKEFLRSLITGIGLDPLEILRSDDDTVINYLLKHLAIEFYPDEVSAITLLEQSGSMTLAQFDNLLAAKESDRSAQNKLVEASKGLLTRLEKTIPSYDEDGTDWTSEAQRLQTERDALVNEVKNFSALKEQEVLANQKSVDQQASFAIEEARLEFERKRAEIQKLAEEEKTAIRSDHTKEISSHFEKIEPKIANLNSDLAVAQERAKQQTRINALRKNVEETRAQFREESQEATRRQRVVEAMRELRRGKLDRLPIPGLEIKNRKLYVDGKLFRSQINTAEQIKVAFQIAYLGLNPEYPIMIADGGDFLNSENIRWLVDAAIGANIQLFITKRVEGQNGLRVMSYEEYLQTVEHVHAHA